MAPAAEVEHSAPGAEAEQPAPGAAAAPSLAERVFGLDLRSLALLRVGAGLLALVDLAVRAGDLRAHYTDFGVLPSAEAAGYPWRTVWNLHTLASPHPEAVALLFALQALLAAALVLGWRTRVANLGLWLLLASLQYRHPILNFGGDVLLRMLLFWGLFLPLGARWSLDARRAPERAPAADRYVSVASAALLLQIALVYWFSVLNRSGPTWWNGQALHDALHLDTFASAAGIWLRQHEMWLAPMTHVAIWFEALGPLLAFVPFRTGPFRTLAVVLFLGFHASLALLFQIGLFPAVFSVAWIGLLPTWFWERLGVGARRAAPAAGPGRGAVPGAWRWSWLREGLAGFALVWVVLSNLSTLRDANWSAWLPRGWDLPAQVAWLDQRWGLFAPDPARHDGWYVVKGVTIDGEEVNLQDAGAPLRFAKPEVVSDTMNIRWREFFFQIQRQADDPRLVFYGRWLCRAWNERHEGRDRLDRVYLYFVQETTYPHGPEREGVLTLLAQDCPAGERPRPFRPPSAGRP